MKRSFFILAFLLTTVAVTYAQMCYAETTFNREKNRLLEIARSGTLPNGCGSAGSPQTLINILNRLGDGGACDIHDREYSTLGISKETADRNFYNNLIRAGVPDYLATIFYNTVRYGGQDAYESAQVNARRFRQLENDPSSRQYSIPSDNPYKRN